MILCHCADTLQHLGVFFVGFSSAFNIILPSILHVKLLHTEGQQPLCWWVLDFFTERVQVVKCNNKTLKPLTISTGTLQG